MVMENNIILNFFDGRIIETKIIKDEQEVLTTEAGEFKKDDIESIVWVQDGNNE